MCTNKCTIKLDDLINNLNNESLKKICLTINNCVIFTTDKKILNFYESHSKINGDILTNTNKYIIGRHFFLKPLKM